MILSIAERIRRHRRQRRESQAKVAQRLGTSQQLVSRIEQGGGSLEQILRLCRATGLEFTLEIGGRRLTLAHPLDPEERKEIEANIDWFTRLEPASRLRVIARHVDAALRLKKAASHGK